MKEWLKGANVGKSLVQAHDMHVGGQEMWPGFNS